MEVQSAQEQQCPHVGDVSPELVLQMDVLGLAQRSVEALGVTGDGDAAHIMECSISRVCLELGLVETALDRRVHQTANEELMNALYLLSGVRARLALAQHNASFLAATLYTATNPITPEQVALAGSTYEADYDLAGATLRQCADDIDVVISAVANGLDDAVIQTVLTGIAQRMVMAARVAEQSEGGAP